MKFTYRSPFAMIMLTIVTLGFYLIYWTVSTRNALNRNGGNVPTGWLIIIPVANIYFAYRFAENFSKIVLKDKAFNTSLLVFFSLFLLPVSAIILQLKINENCAYQD